MPNVPGFSPLDPSYSPISRSQFRPLAGQGQFANSFSQEPSSAQRNRATGQPTGANQPTNRPAAQQPQSQASQSGMTFSQMQAQGIARPAPPRANAAPYQGQLNESISGLLAKPSGYGSDVVQGTFNQLAGDIDDDFEQNNRRIDERMAGRGFYDSTRAGGELYDSNVGRRSAKTALATTLLDRQAQQFTTDRAAAIAAALQGSQQGFAQELGAAEYGEGQRRADNAMGFQYDQLNASQGNASADRELRAWEAGNQNEVARGQLALGRDELGFRREDSAASREQAGQQFAQRMGLDYAQLSLADRNAVADRALRSQDLSQTREYQQGQLAQSANELGFRREDSAANRGVDYARLAQGDRQFDRSNALQRDELGFRIADATAGREIDRGRLGLDGRRIDNDYAINSGQLALGVENLRSQDALGNRRLDIDFTQGRDQNLIALLNILNGQEYGGAGSPRTPASGGGNTTNNYYPQNGGSTGGGSDDRYNPGVATNFAPQAPPAGSDVARYRGDASSFTDAAGNPAADPAGTVRDASGRVRGRYDESGRFVPEPGYDIPRTPQGPSMGANGQWNNGQSFSLSNGQYYTGGTDPRVAPAARAQAYNDASGASALRGMDGLTNRADPRAYIPTQVEVGPGQYITVNIPNGNRPAAAAYDPRSVYSREEQDAWNEQVGSWGDQATAAGQTRGTPNERAWDSTAADAAWTARDAERERREMVLNDRVQQERDKWRGGGRAIFDVLSDKNKARFFNKDGAFNEELYTREGAKAAQRGYQQRLIADRLQDPEGRVDPTFYDRARAELAAWEREMDATDGWARNEDELRAANTVEGGNRVRRQQAPAAGQNPQIAALLAALMGGR